MTPIEELKQLRKDEGVHDTMTVSERTLLSEGMKQVELNLYFLNRTLNFN